MVDGLGYPPVQVPGSTFSKKRLIDGSNFLGEIKDGKPHGYGLIVYPANDKQQRDRFGGLEFHLPFAPSVNADTLEQVNSDTEHG